MSAKKPAFRKSRHNKTAILCICMVAAMLMAVLAIDGVKKMNNYRTFSAKQQELQSAIDAANDRAAWLVEFEKYTKTKKYAEEIAENKLGLVHEGEIIFKTDANK